MSSLVDAIEEALPMLGEGAHVEAIAERQGIARFGGSRITYQHDEERTRVRIRITRDGRTACATTESLDPDTVRAARVRLERLLVALPPCAMAPLAPIGEPPAPRDPPPEPSAAADERVGWFDAVRAELGPDVELGGSATHIVTEHVVASDEVRRHERRTKAALQVVGRRGDRSGYAKALSRDPAAIDPVVLADEVTRSLEPQGSHDLTAGGYPVLFGPHAAATLLGTYAHIALSGGEYDGGQSVVSGQLGEPVTSPLLDLHDDATDPAGLPTGFDPEGVAKQPTPLIEGGVLRGVVHDRRTAAQAGTASTGHAVPPAWRFGAGPAVSHLVLGAGDASDADLLAALDRGLVVQRVDYLRVLQPRDTLVTGTTRDATLWVDGGRVVARTPQFRFTARLSDLLSGVIAVGAARQTCELVFCESVVSPALLVESVPIG